MIPLREGGSGVHYMPFPSTWKDAPPVKEEEKNGLAAPIAE